jgi:rhamnogalacturonyl hydrolase YesR
MFLLLVLTAARPSRGVGSEETKNQILAALHQGAQYAGSVLLDSEGKSRCDYNLLAGTWSDYEPAWHTGQLIYGLIRAFDITHEPRYLADAQRAGEWWISLAIHDHPGLDGMVRAIHGDGIDYIIFATVSDGSAGLFELYKRTGDKRFAAIPSRAGAWMYAHMYEPQSRMFYDAVDPRSGEVLKINSPFWPEKSKQTVNDVARPNNEGSLYKDIYEFTGEATYRDLFLELCESLVEKQDENGLWMQFTPNHKSEGTFHPRFNIWYAESLLYGYELSGNRTFLDAALRTGRFYTRFQQSNGAFYYHNRLDGSGDPYSISGSTVSFAGILWLRLRELAATREFDANIESSLRWILQNRYPSDHPDKNLAGGFIEIRCKGGKGKLKVLQRDIATAFALRFLADYFEATCK